MATILAKPAEFLAEWRKIIPSLPVNVSRVVIDVSKLCVELTVTRPLAGDEVRCIDVNVDSGE